MCYFLCFSPFLETPDVVMIFTLFSPFHMFHVLLIWTICFGFMPFCCISPAFPLLDFCSHLKLPVHFRATCCIIKTEKVGHSSKNGDREDQRRHLHAVMYLRSERWVFGFFSKHIFIKEESGGHHLNQVTTFSITNLLKCCKMKYTASLRKYPYQKCLT